VHVSLHQRSERLAARLFHSLVSKVPRSLPCVNFCRPFLCVSRQHYAALSRNAHFIHFVEAPNPDIWASRLFLADDRSHILLCALQEAFLLKTRTDDASDSTRQRMSEPTDSLLNIRRKADSKLPLSQAEWTLVAYYCLHGAEMFANTAQSEISFDSLAGILEAFQAVYALLRKKNKTHLDSFFIAHLPSDRQAEAKSSDEIGSEDVRRPAITSSSGQRCKMVAQSWKQRWHAAWEKLPTPAFGRSFSAGSTRETSRNSRSLAHAESTRRDSWRGWSARSSAECWKATDEIIAIQCSFHPGPYHHRGPSSTTECFAAPSG